MSETKKRGIDKTNCCVYNCHTIRMKENNVSFHRFPKINCGYVFIENAFGNKERVDKRTAWEYVLKMGKPASNYMRVCGKHFQKEDYFCGFTKKPTLKPTAVPSLNLPKLSFNKKVNQESVEQRRQRSRKRQRNAEVSTVVDMRVNCEEIVEPQFEEENCEDPTTLNELTESEQTAVNALLNFKVDSVVKNLSKVDKNIQVTSGDIYNSFSATITSDRHLNSITGIANFKLLRTMTKLVAKYYSTSRSRKMSVEDSIIIVFMKLKMSVTFRVISILFQISPSTCRLIFNEYIQYLSNVLKPCIVWPSIDECRANLPNCFKGYESVRIIVDCMEIPVERPKCRCCRIKTYSHYKGRHTLKFMTVVAPAGLLTFISTCYGGRASDKAIFQQSNIITKLEPHIDSVMADKGFAIQDICNEYFIKLVQPYFLRKKKIFCIRG